MDHCSACSLAVGPRGRTFHLSGPILFPCGMGLTQLTLPSLQARRALSTKDGHPPSVGRQGKGILITLSGTHSKIKDTRTW